MKQHESWYDSVHRCHRYANGFLKRKHVVSIPPDITLQEIYRDSLSPNTDFLSQTGFHFDVHKQLSQPRKISTRHLIDKPKKRRGLFDDSDIQID